MMEMTRLTDARLREIYRDHKWTIWRRWHKAWRDDIPARSAMRDWLVSNGESPTSTAFLGWPGWESLVGPEPDYTIPLPGVTEATDARRAWLSVRFDVLERDCFTCRYCGRCAPSVPLEVDHVFPRSKGGSDDYGNLVTACYDCNRGKRARVLEVTL